MRQFEVGKKYTHGWISNSEHFTTWEVVKRTEQTITITNGTETKTCKIVKKLSEWSGAECIRPFGNYSMCPILEA